MVSSEQKFNKYNNEFKNKTVEEYLSDNFCRSKILSKKYNVLFHRVNYLWFTSFNHF
ncbi:MAG: hypothetical protein PHS24_00055 [Bacilli bacterium]|nr:hypothetical protein [Bacilli bacterium]